MGKITVDFSQAYNPADFKEIRIGYKPRELLRQYHERKQRWAIIVAHRRFGKTVGVINQLIYDCMNCTKPNPRYAYVAPTYGQAKDVAWEYLKQYGLKIDGAVASESELRIDFPNGGRVRLYGSDNYDRMRGIYLDGVVLDEYGDQDPRAWTEVIRPALSDRKGNATFIGTPKGDNHFRELWDFAVGSDEWFTLMLKASATGILDDEELASARRMMTAEQYNAEYECSFEGSVVGSYYGEYLAALGERKMIGNFGWLPEYSVHTAWDVGGTTAVWMFQIVGSTIRVIDYLEGVNKSADWYSTELLKRPYTYGTHIGPWDADLEKEIVGKSWKTSLEDLGIVGWEILEKQTSVDDGINQARLLIPRCQFNVVGDMNCKDGYTGLVNYRREWDEKRKKFRDVARHDWASHPADAFRYLSLGLPLIREAMLGGASSDWSAPIKYRGSGII